MQETIWTQSPETGWQFFAGGAKPTRSLKIGIEFDDTHRLFGLPRSGIGFDPDILGAIFFELKRIVIDESLDPEPSRRGTAQGVRLSGSRHKARRCDGLLW